MVSDGQRPFDVFSEEVTDLSYSLEKMRCQVFVSVSCAYIWEKLSYVDAAWFCREVHERVAVLDLRERKRQASYRVHVWETTHERLVFQSITQQGTLQAHTQILVSWYHIDSGLWFSGYSIGDDLDATCTTWTNDAEGISDRRKIREREKILRSDAGRPCALTRRSREASEREQPRRSLQDQRKWSFSFLLKASVSPQDPSRDCTDSLRNILTISLEERILKYNLNWEYLVHWDHLSYYNLLYTFSFFWIDPQFIIIWFEDKKWLNTQMLMYLKIFRDAYRGRRINKTLVIPSL